MFQDFEYGKHYRRVKNTFFVDSQGFVKFRIERLTIKYYTDKNSYYPNISLNYWQAENKYRFTPPGLKNKDIFDLTKDKEKLNDEIKDYKKKILGVEETVKNQKLERLLMLVDSGIVDVKTAKECVNTDNLISQNIEVNDVLFKDMNIFYKLGDWLFGDCTIYMEQYTGGYINQPKPLTIDEIHRITPPRTKGNSCWKYDLPENKSTVKMPKYTRSLDCKNFESEPTLKIYKMTKKNKRKRIDKEFSKYLEYMYNESLYDLLKDKE
jgi:hypothetical protein